MNFIYLGKPKIFLMRFMNLESMNNEDQLDKSIIGKIMKINKIKISKSLFEISVQNH